MATRDHRRETGRERGETIVRRLAAEIRVARQNSGLSQQALANVAGWTQTEVSRFERNRFASVSLPRLAQLGAALGLELGAGLPPVGDPIHDRGQQAAIARFLGCVADS